MTHHLPAHAMRHSSAAQQIELFLNAEQRSRWALLLIHIDEADNELRAGQTVGRACGYALGLLDSGKIEEYQRAKMEQLAQGVSMITANRFKNEEFDREHD